MYKPNPIGQAASSDITDILSLVPRLHGSLGTRLGQTSSLRKECVCLFVVLHRVSLIVCKLQTILHVVQTNSQTTDSQGERNMTSSRTLCIPNETREAVCRACIVQGYRSP